MRQVSILFQLMATRGFNTQIQHFKRSPPTGMDDPVPGFHPGVAGVVPGAEEFRKPRGFVKRCYRNFRLGITILPWRL